MVKKKIAIINSVCGTGSTGRICTELSHFLRKNEFETMIYFGRNENRYFSEDSFCFSSMAEVKFHAIASRLFDSSGFGSNHATKKLISELDSYGPDLIIINNLHGYYLNLNILLNWLTKKRHIPLLFIFHDSWNFTGHCACFEYVRCEKWKSLCQNCPQKHEYPKSILFDNSKHNYLIKKDLFAKLSNLTIVCPSKWMAGLVKESFLKNHDIRIINNGINDSIFKQSRSDFREKYNLNGKLIILCVASVFDKKKGISDIIKLSEIIDDNTRIIIVGKIYNKRIKLPDNILHINRTDNPYALASIYSTADVFFNPTYEDNYPNVNIESLSCRTPVICYRTGGAIETVDSQFIVEKGDYRQAYELMKKIFNDSISYRFEDNSNYSLNNMHNQYMNLIKEKLGL